MNFEPDALLALTGIVLSLVFGYFPMLKTWFDGLNPVYRPLVMAGILLLVTVGKLVAECSAQFACIGANWQLALWGWFGALVANQTTFLVAVKQPREARLEREYLAQLPGYPGAEDGK